MPDTYTVTRICGHTLDTDITDEAEALEVAVECAQSNGKGAVVYYEMSGDRAGKRSLVATVDGAGEVTAL
jgi:hypothetical protein